MNDDKVFELLMETNPVPDPDGLDSPLALAELERRNPTMAANQPSSGNRSNGLLIGAVAAVAVLIVGLGSWAAFANGSDTSTTAVVAATTTTSPSTTTAPTTTPPTEAESLALATVLEYYDALNRGDIPAMTEMLTGPAAARFGDFTFETILAAANHRRDITEPCRVLDVGVDHQGFPIDPDNPETAVECTISSYDEFYGPAGAFIDPHVVRFYITADAKIVDSFEEGAFELPETDPASLWAYNRAFYDWLAVAYPDVYEQIKVADGESAPGWFAQDPGHMTIAIEYVEEFVAQSDVYPLDPDNG